MTHDWQLDEHGEIDLFALDVDTEGMGHNGPHCLRCDVYYCEHCTPDWRETECAG